MPMIFRMPGVLRGVIRNGNERAVPGEKPMSSSNSSLMSHAERLADLLSLVTGVREVALFGSLAREKERTNANDIDIVILHDGSLPDGSSRVLRGKMFTWRYGSSCMQTCWGIREGKDSLRRLLGIRSYPVLRYIQDNVGCGIDFIFANHAVLTDCDVLRGFSVTCPDPEFSNRVFCELPLVWFDVTVGRFDLRNTIKHKDGICCKPEVSWEKVRGQKGRDPSGISHIISTK